jgi:protein gp37
MAITSSIEWTDASWNCLAGCEAVSPGCAHCYAATMTRRLEAMGQADYAGLTTAKHFNGKVRCLPHKLDVPLKWRKPRRVFVNSMSDLFHEDVPDAFIRQVFGVMSNCGQHTFQILTKRAQRMADWFADQANRLTACQAEFVVDDDAYAATRTPTGRNRVRDLRAINGTHGASVGDGNYWPLPNVWLGVSAEDQQRADERIPWLLQTPAAVRFVSAEPLLGAIDLWKWITPKVCKCRGNTDCECFPGKSLLDWIIAGGESGPHARPSHPDWFRSLRDQCQAAGVAFFFKQWGEWLPSEQDGNPDNPRGQELNCSSQPVRVGKKAAGRLPDGHEWNEFPTPRSSMSFATVSG